MSILKSFFTQILRSGRISIVASASGGYEVPSWVGPAQFALDTGTGAIAFTLDPMRDWQLESIGILLSAVGGAGNLTATLDHVAGSAFDRLIHVVDMTSRTSYEYRPERPMEFQKGTSMDFVWANGSGRTYGLEIVWKLR